MTQARLRLESPAPEMDASEWKSDGSNPPAQSGTASAGRLTANGPAYPGVVLTKHSLEDDQ